jgi:putative transcriptional regulator
MDLLVLFNKAFQKTTDFVVLVEFTNVLRLIQLTIDKQRTPEKGDLLLSEPFMLDDHFTRSVIYLCEHNEDGSFGFILNNTLDLNLHEYATDFPDARVTVGFGGPVDQNQLFFLHNISELEDKIEVSSNIFMGGRYATILEMLQKKTISAGQIRFFIGYTGWGPNQLQQELDEKTWIVASPPPDLSILDSNDDTLWKDVLHSMGGKYKLMADFPINPADN